MKKRAVIYCRVSSKRQEENTSLDSQKRGGKAYAAKHGFSVVDTIEDAFTSETLNRPGMNRLRAMLKAGKVDAVISLDNDRLSREPLHYHVFRDELLELGVELHFTTEGAIDLNDLGVQVTQDIKGRFSKLWKQKIIERTKDGRLQRSKDGMCMVIRPAFGYRIKKEVEVLETGRVIIKDRQLEPHEVEAPIVKEIFELYVYSDKSMVAVADHLTAKGYKTRGDKVNHGKRKRECYWSDTSVRKILKNTAYMGTFYYGGIEVEVPAIVSPQLWKEAQKKREKITKFMSRRRKYEYLLSERVMCAECNHHMTGSNVPEAGLKYYRCNCCRRKKYSQCFCTNSRGYRADKVEDTVIDWLVSVLQDEEKLEEGLEKYQADQAAIHAPLTEELEKTRKVVDKLEARLNRLLDLYLDGDMDKSLFVGKEVELKKDVADGKERIAEIEKKLEQVLLTPGRINNIKQFAAEFREGAEELPNDPEEKKELLVALDVQVWLTPLPKKQMKIKVIAAIGETEDASNIGIDNTLSKQRVGYSKTYLSAEFIV